MLVILNNLSSQQAHPTLKTKQKLQQLMDYANTYPDVTVRFYASDIQLYIDTDAAYLVLPKARSRVAGYFRLLKHNPSPSLDNGPILIECRTLRNVVTSAAESETHSVFYSAKQSLSIRYILETIGHIQLQPNPLRTDNSTSAGYINKNM